MKLFSFETSNNRIMPTPTLEDDLSQIPSKATTNKNRTRLSTTQTQPFSSPFSPSSENYDYNNADVPDNQPSSTSTRAKSIRDTFIKFLFDRVYKNYITINQTKSKTTTMKQIPLNKVTTTIREKSAFGKDGNHCLCSVLKPILYFGQIFGILPITFTFKNGMAGNKCKMKYSWKSIPSAINLIWILANIGGGFYFFPRIYGLFGKHFEGTDFYTHAIAWTIEILSTNVLFLVGHKSAINFSRAWQTFHGTIDEIALKNFKTLKYVGYLIPIFLAQDVLGYIFLVGSAKLLLSGVSFDAIAIGFNGATFIANFIPNLSSIIFILLSYIASKNFVEINQQLMQLSSQLKKGSNENEVAKWPDEKICKRLGRLRILHENLCGSVRGLQDAFGLQMIAVFIGASVSFVVGIYGLATSTTGGGSLAILQSANALNSIFSCLRMILVVYTCQCLTNNAFEAGHILNRFYLDDSSEETKQEVDEFLKKVGLFPLHLTACGVFELGNKILATGTGNVITYVLVLMQFRLDQPSAEIVHNNNMTMSN